MTKKRLVLLLVVLACVVLAGYMGFKYAFSLSPGIAPANFDRLRAEMTVHQAERLFGGPCHDKVPFEPEDKMPLRSGDFVDHMQIWRVGEDEIRVSFAHQGKVCGGTATFGGRSEMLVEHPSLLERLSRIVLR
jgi:hypothetical protein